MADINFSQIVSDSMDFAKKEVGKSWSKLKPYAEHEFTQFAENAVFLAKLKLAGTIEDDELKARLNIQRIALNNVLLALKGIGLVTAQNVVNGVLDIVTKSIKKTLQVVLPI
jgi:hypothetical protein